MPLLEAGNQERRAVSRASIARHILKKSPKVEKNSRTEGWMTRALNALETEGEIVRVSGSGGSGTFKLPQPEHAHSKAKRTKPSSAVKTTSSGSYVVRAVRDDSGSMLATKQTPETSTKGADKKKKKSNPPQSAAAGKRSATSQAISKQKASTSAKTSSRRSPFVSLSQSVYHFVF